MHHTHKDTIQPKQILAQVFFSCLRTHTHRKEQTQDVFLLYLTSEVQSIFLLVMEKSQRFSLCKSV